MTVQGRSVDVPATQWGVELEADSFAPVPAMGAQGGAIRAEFSADAG